MVARQGGVLTEISRKQLSNLYLGKAKSELVVYDQKDRLLRERFYHEVLGLSLPRVRAYWSKRVFTGRGRPPTMLQADEAAKTIQNQSVAIAYFFADQQPEETVVLFSTHKQERP